MIGTLEPPDAPADLGAVEVGQSEVEQDQIGVAHVEAAAPVSAWLTVKAVAGEALDERFGDGGGRPDDQEVHGDKLAHGQRSRSDLYRTLADA
jgi:hypothetical protein